MYGYFNPLKVCLRNNELAIFNAYYCRLCYCLWNKGGQRARFLTTYDAVVYNLVLTIAGADTTPQTLPCQKIATSHKKMYRSDENGNLLADLSVLGFAIKVKDNRADGETFKAFMANFLFGGLCKKTEKKYTDLFAHCDASIAEMDRMQAAGAPIGDVLSAYAATMEYAFRQFFKAEDKYFTLINLIARWTFLIDMVDDYDEDVKKKRVNSLIRPDSPTRDVLFDKHYTELLPFFRAEEEALRDAINAIRCEMPEWLVLHKILRHSLATLIPDILCHEDVRFHYFRDTYLRCRKAKAEKRINKKYEKNPMYYKGH